MSPPRDAAALAEHLTALGRLLRHSIETQAQRLPVPLTPAQVLAMQVLVETDREGVELSLSDLSQRMGLAHSTVSGVVTRLENRGLVRRSVGIGDRRQLRIQLTEQVRSWVEHELPQLRQQPLAAALGELGEQRTAALIDELALLRKHLEGRNSRDQPTHRQKGWPAGSA